MLEPLSLVILGVPALCVVLIVALTLRALFQYAADEIATAWRNAWERLR